MLDLVQRVYKKETLGCCSPHSGYCRPCRDRQGTTYQLGRFVTSTQDLREIMLDDYELQRQQRRRLQTIRFNVKICNFDVEQARANVNFAGQIRCAERNSIAWFQSHHLKNLAI
jgi:hypothetical protein